MINSCQNDTDAVTIFKCVTNTSLEVLLQGPDFQRVLAQRQTSRDHSPLRAMLMPA